ncbi:inositol monophosphatase family protein [Altererythrobacter sp. B11]|uniref:inositol monophosphatase family protein n=1 Tax=Altererythrobacter sp. B11 TaxID=2060312 RepID=UPI000E5B879E|nr:inositol monophosphatase family protein [Altererythrobacter sp. B11]
MLALMRQVTQDVILPRFQNLAEGEVFDKGGNDPVTVADREAEAALREGLAKLNPGIGFVGEEAAHAEPAILDRLDGPCWIVDPVDGTRNFAAGQAPFGIIVALADGGEAHSGWIFDCLSGRFCAAHLGKGAFVDGEQISARATGEEPPVAAISMIFMDDAKRAAMLDTIAPHYRLVDIPYCAAEQYPRLALGVNDVSVFERTLAWDHAAGALWLNEAGGKAARPDGSPYRANERGRTGLIGAASPDLWDDLAGRLAAFPA